jgi:2,4-dienoyl-CoA reductase-like NADH-dependent reductase (Old Yellow Enzyme family)
LALGRRHFGGKLIGNDSYKLEGAQAAVSSGELAAVSFARHFIGNPDLVERLKNGQPLSKFDMATLYTPGAEGYSSYPVAESD